MAKYIDADVLKDEIQGARIIQKPKYLDAEETFKIIDMQPTADVEEVKHGEWKDRFGDKYDNHLYECSVCGEKALYRLYKDELGITRLEQALTLGCPYCLAKMDGGNAE